MKKQSFEGLAPIKLASPTTAHTGSHKRKLMYAALAKTAQPPKQQPYLGSHLHSGDVPHSGLNSHLSSKSSSVKVDSSKSYPFSTKMSPSRSIRSSKRTSPTTNSRYPYAMLTHNRNDRSTSSHSSFDRSGGSTSASKPNAGSSYAICDHGLVSSLNLSKRYDLPKYRSKSYSGISLSGVEQLSRSSDKAMSRESYLISVIKEHLDSEGNDTRRSANVFLESDRITQVDLQDERRAQGKQDQNQQESGKYKLSAALLEDGASTVSQECRSQEYQSNKKRSIKYNIKQFSGQASKSGISYPFTSVLSAAKSSPITSAKSSTSVLKKSWSANRSSNSEKENHSSALKQPKQPNPSSLSRSMTSSSSSKPVQFGGQSAISNRICPIGTRRPNSEQVTTQKVCPGNTQDPLVRVLPPPSNNQLSSSLNEGTHPYYLGKTNPHSEKGLLITISSDASANLDNSEDYLLYRKNLTRSLSLLREKRISFSTLSAIKGLYKPHRSAVYACMSLVALLSGSCEYIPKEIIFNKSTTWDEVKAYLKKTDCVHTQLLHLSTRVDRTSPSKQNINEALIHLDRSLEALKGTENMPWHKLVKEIDDFLQLAINHSRLLCKDESSKQLLLKCLESPSDPTIQTQFLQFEELPQSVQNYTPPKEQRLSSGTEARASISPRQLQFTSPSTSEKKADGYRPRSTPHKSLSTPKRFPSRDSRPQNGIYETSSSTKKPNSSPVSLEKQLSSADRGYKLNLKHEEIHFSLPPDVFWILSRASAEDIHTLTLCSALFSLFENSITSLPLFLGRYTKNWDVVIQLLQKHAHDLSALAGSFRHLLDTDQITKNNVREAKKLLRKVEGESTLDEVDEKIASVREALTSYLSDAFAHFESIHGTLKIWSEDINTRSPERNKSRTGAQKPFRPYNSSRNGNLNAVARSSKSYQSSRRASVVNKSIEHSIRVDQCPAQDNKKFLLPSRAGDHKTAVDLTSDKSLMAKRVLKGSVFDRQIKSQKLKLQEKYLQFERDCRTKTRSRQTSQKKSNS